MLSAKFLSCPLTFRNNERRDGKVVLGCELGERKNKLSWYLQEMQLFLLGLNKALGVSKEHPRSKNKTQFIQDLLCAKQMLSHTGYEHFI